jgi:hypothetical protein
VAWVQRVVPAAGSSGYLHAEMALAFLQGCRLAGCFQQALGLPFKLLIMVPPARCRA